jgi:cation:H+ antiporter
VTALLVPAGVGLLYAGGEVLVRNAVRLARAAGMSALTVGLTVVAFATSAPELATTLVAGFGDAPGTALGNVVGSNIANLGLVLGAMALVRPLRSKRRSLRREVPFMIAAGALLFPLLANGALGRPEGVVLLAALGTYFALLLVYRPAVPGDGPDGEGTGRAGSPWVALCGVGLGVALLVGGAQMLVEGAVGLARELGVTERVIGLTLVAVGGSLPELAGSVVAAARRQGNLILGNLVGSNVFNASFVLGVTALAVPLEVDFAAFRADLLMMLGLSLFVLPFLATGRVLNRVEGLALLAAYAGYVAVLFL